MTDYSDNIFLVTENQELRQGFARGEKESLGKIKVVERSESLPSHLKESSGLMITDSTGLQDKEKFIDFLNHGPHKKMLLFDSLGESEVHFYKAIATHANIHHFLLGSVETKINEIRQDIHLFSSKQKFEDFMTQAELVEAIKITGSDQFPQLMKSMVDHGNQLNLSTQIIETATNVVSELSLNSVFSVPFDRVLRAPKFAHMDRNSRVKVDPHDQAELSFLKHPDFFLIKVVDGFGVLNKNHVLSSIRRGIAGNMKPGNRGAGVGFFLLLTLASKLVIQIHPEKQTEITCFFKLTKKNREFVEFPKSFHFMEESYAFGNSHRAA